MAGCSTIAGRLQPRISSGIKEVSHIVGRIGGHVDCGVDF
jgi:hypothetical protein